jgi:hypothetical protein
MGGGGQTEDVEMPRHQLVTDPEHVDSRFPRRRRASHTWDLPRHATTRGVHSLATSLPEADDDESHDRGRGMRMAPPVDSIAVGIAYKVAHR